MSSKQGAYGARAGDTDFRKKWDKEEYAEKARQRDQEVKERMQENEERLKQGAPPDLTHPISIPPSPTSSLCDYREEAKAGPQG